FTRWSGLAVWFSPTRRVVLSEGLSTVGDGVFWVGLLVWLLDRPHGVGLVALAAVARLSPRVLFRPVAGALADRVDRRGLLVVLDVVRSVLMVTGAGLIANGAAPWTVLALVFITYTLATPHRAAFTAGVPFVVGERDAAATNSMIRAVRQAATFFGPLLGT